MADERKIGAVEIDRLYDFLDGLQASGYTIDPRQYLALSDLLMALIARGDSLEELPLKTMIAPLICSTPAEQQDFYQRFDRWYPTLLPVKQASLSGDGIAISSPTKQRRSLPTINRTAVIWVTVVVAVITLIVWLISNSAATGTQVINSTVSLYGAIFAVFGFMVWLGWRASILYQENQYITRELANQEPVYTKVPVKAYIQDVMPVMQFKPIVSALRKRTQVPSSEVDVDRTIENALHRDNWLEIVYRQRHVMPEYVVLIDRKSRLDQQARFVQEVLAKLAADGVWLQQYEFSGDPRICFPLDRKDTPLRLKDLQARHPDSRLLIFSGTNELINPLTGLLQDWLESLSYWQERAILTPDKLQEVLLEELQSRDFAVLPMNFDGLASLVRTFEAENAPLLTNGGVGLPAQLTERPMRWTGRDTPPEAEVKALVNDVKSYLGENGFYWLCATAVYPELRWELTLYLGSSLNDNLGQPLLNPERLLSLAHLPWFRFGHMPDWVRSAFIDNMNEGEETNVRGILGTLLETSFQSENTSLDLQMAKKQFVSLSEHSKRILRFIYSNRPAENPLHDYIFIKFILKKDEKRLAVLFNRLSNRFVFFTGVVNRLRSQLGQERSSSVELSTNEEITSSEIVQDEPLEGDRPDKESLRAFISAIQPFNGLYVDQIISIAEKIEVLFYPNGKEIFHKGDKGNAVYFIYKGKAKIIRPSDEAEKRSIILASGDCFGEQEVLTGRKRFQTVISVSGIILLKLKTENLKEITQDIKGVLANFKILAETLRLKRILNFAWLGPKEIIYFLARKHKIRLYQSLMAPLFVLMIPFLLFLGSFVTSVTILYVVGGLILLVDILWAIWQTVDWSNNYFIVTSQRIIWIEKVLGYDSRQEAPLNMILSVDVDVDQLGKILDYGDISMRTIIGKITFNFVEYPNHVARLIEGYLKQAKEQTGETQKNTLTRAVQSRLSYTSTSATTWWSKTFNPIIELLNNSLMLRIEEANTITYRQHWSAFFSNISNQINIFLFILFVLVFQPYFLGGYTIWFSILGIGLLIADIYWSYRGFVDWTNNLYQVTPKQIFHIRRKSNGREDLSSVRIEDILGTEFKRSGFGGTLLNFGTVTITLENEKFSIVDVLDPPGVQIEINRRRFELINNGHGTVITNKPAVANRNNQEQIGVDAAEGVAREKMKQETPISKVSNLIEDSSFELELISEKEIADKFEEILGDDRLYEYRQECQEAADFIDKVSSKYPGKFKKYIESFYSSSQYIPTYKAGLVFSAAFRALENHYLKIEYSDILKDIENAVENGNYLKAQEILAVNSELIKKGADNYLAEIWKNSEKIKSLHERIRIAEEERVARAKIEAEVKAAEKAAREKAEREAIEKAEQERLERERQLDKSNYRGITSKSSQETEIAIWGPTRSGKDWLFRAFAKELEFYNSRYDDFLFELREISDIGDNFRSIVVAPPEISPTTVREDYIYAFSRRPITDTDSHKISAFTHNIVFHNNRGADLIASIMNNHGLESTYYSLMRSRYILITLDPLFEEQSRSWIDNPDRKLDNDSFSDAQEGYPDIALRPGLSKDQYFQILIILLQALADSKVQDRYLAVCITKTDTLRFIGNNPWMVLERLYGQKISKLFNAYRTQFNIEVFLTSAVGFTRVRGEQIPNFDVNNGSLIDTQSWKPINCATPFFWLFENQEIEQIKAKSNFINRESNLRRYIKYPPPIRF